MTDRQLAPLFTWRSAICDSELTATARHVALTLSLYMNERGGSAFPGAERLAHDTGLSERAVRDHLNGLVHAGWLVLLHRGGGRKNANEYGAAIPADIGQSKEEPAAPFSDRNPASDDTNPADDDAKPCTTFPPTLQELSIELSTGGDDAPPLPIPLESRRRNPVFEAVAEACGIDWREGLTKAARGRIGKAAADIEKAGGTAEEVLVRARRYVAKYGADRITPSALASHWPALTASNVAGPDVSRATAGIASWLQASQR
jgi:hypothetical protein